MGVIKKNMCRHCDFVADEVFVGSGRSSCQVPVICQDCGEVTSCPTDQKTGKLKEEYAHCPKCDSENLIVWDRNCPKCGSSEVDEKRIGMWD